ncbi:TPA: FRG domain-containing protein [Serratia fonticola]
MIKEEFEVCYSFENIADFFNFFTPWSNEYSLDDYVFRGHSSDKYELVPLALRKDNAHELAEINLNSVSPSNVPRSIRQIIVEKGLLRDFYKIANEHGLIIPMTRDLSERLYMRSDLRAIYSFSTPDMSENKKWPSNEILELSALAQHYGLPTRLLDWTDDPFIAIYFALRSAMGKEGNLEIWCINRGVITKGESAGMDLGVKFYTPHYANNPNIRAQKGLFTYYPVDDKITLDSHIEANKNVDDIDRRPLNLIMKETVYPPFHPSMFKRVTLPCHLAKEAFKTLSRLGYSSARVYPGYDGVVKEINDRRLIQRGGISNDSFIP